MSEELPPPLVSIILIGSGQSALLDEVVASVRELWVPGNATVEITYIDHDEEALKKAKELGVALIALPREGYNGAKARNAGLRQAKGSFLFFLDGENAVDPNFLIEALPYFSAEDIAVVCGRWEEAHPSRTFWSQALSLDASSSPGLVRYCGSDALIRRWLLQEVGGYDETFSAGEEVDLCRRLRGEGYRILRADLMMSSCHLAGVSFKEYWAHLYRRGYAYAEISRRYRNSSDPIWRREARNNLLIGGTYLSLLIVSWLTVFLLATPYPLLIYFLLLLLLSLKSALFLIGSWRALFAYGVHTQLRQFPLFFGQLAYWKGRFL